MYDTLFVCRGTVIKEAKGRLASQDLHRFRIIMTDDVSFTLFV
jgi:hypothetical protein